MSFGIVSSLYNDCGVVFDVVRMGRRREGRKGLISGKESGIFIIEGLSKSLLKELNKMVDR